MTIRVTVLGTSAMYATVDRACSGYLVEAGGARVWMDAGGGTWRNLQRHIDYHDIDGILLSHRHPDHTIDLFQIFHARRYGEAHALARVPLWAPRETIERVTAYARELSESFDLRPIDATSEVEIAGARVSFVSMVHPAETVGIRISDGEAVVAYSADTGPDADLYKLAAGSDLFMCEATFQNRDRVWSGHMTAAQAGTAAAKGGVGRLALTHLPARHDLSVSLEEATDASDGIPVILMEDGATYEAGA